MKRVNKVMKYMVFDGELYKRATYPMNTVFGWVKVEGLTLSNDDFNKFMELIDNPPKASNKLITLLTSKKRIW